jgi:SAM-dependent methyltransferase
MNHPYRTAPDQSFWSRAVSRVSIDDFDPVSNVSFSISAADRIATAGSCFAQHITRHLRTVGITPLVTERPHPEVAGHGADFHYGVYAARYGNVYTARQLLQLFERAFREFQPIEPPWRAPDGSFIDPFRPGIPGGFGTLREFERQREIHLAAVCEMFNTLDVFIFTLGLTEGWVSREDGAVFPSCPGVVGGTWDEVRYVFHNFTAAETVRDLRHFLNGLRAINPTCRVIMTVSPVPLVATATGGHVVPATIYSKSVLRVAAQEAADSFDQIDYFPSYEIITGPQAAASYFTSNRRDVTEDGIAAVMKVFSRHYLQEERPYVASLPQSIGVPSHTDLTRAAIDAICDETYNDYVQHGEKDREEFKTHVANETSSVMTVAYDRDFALQIETAKYSPTDRAQLVQTYWQLHPRIAFFHSLDRNARVLDMGAGEGGMVHARQVYFPDRSDMRMYAVDLVEGKYFHLYDDYQICDIDKDELKFPAHSFNGIVAAHVFAHLNDPLRFLHNCERLLVPGGQVYIELPSPHSAALPHSRVLQDHGIPAIVSNFFEEVPHVRTYAPEHVAAMAAAYGLRQLASGTIHNAFVADALLSYAAQNGDQECAVYGLWAKLQWSGYVILQKPSELTRYIDTRDTTRCRDEYERDVVSAGSGRGTDPSLRGADRMVAEPTYTAD